MKRKIILGVLIIIGIAAIIGYRMYSKERSDVSSDTPDVTVSATDLIAAFEKDTAAASKKYVDKTVEVTGTVKTIDTSGAVVLGDEGSLSEVVIGIDTRYVKDLASLKVGSVAVLQGICSGYNKSSGDPNDMLSGLGTTVQLWSASVKHKK